MSNRHPASSNQVSSGRGGRAHCGYPVKQATSRVLGSRLVMGLAATATVLLAVVAALSPSWLLRIDEPVSEWVRGDGSFHRLVVVVTHLGSPILTTIAATVAAAWLWSKCRAAAVASLGLAAAAIVADIGIKVAVGRARPVNPDIATTFGSFPSGHVIHAVVLFGFGWFLWWAFSEDGRLARRAAPAFSLIVGLVAVSRVRLGAHWPSDVVAGLVIGAALLLAAQRALMSVWAQRRCDALGLHQSAG